MGQVTYTFIDPTLFSLHRFLCTQPVFALFLAKQQLFTSGTSRNFIERDFFSHNCVAMDQPIVDDKVDDKKIRDVEAASLDETASLGKGDILSLENTDPVLNAKMHLINNVSATQLQFISSSLRLKHTLPRSNGADADVALCYRPSMRLASRRGRSNCSFSMALGNYVLLA